MFWLYLRLSLFLFLLFTVFVISVQIMYYKGNPVDDLINTQANCDSICLFSIQPGKTTVGEAKSLLSNHTWVADVREFAPGTGYAQVSWGWNGEQPDIIDPSRRGTLTFVWDDDDPDHTKIVDSVVETVSIYTRANIHMFEKFYGETSNRSVNDQLEGMLGYRVYYNMSGGNMTLKIDVACPANLASYWSSSVHMTVSIGQIKTPNISPLDMMSIC